MKYVLVLIDLINRNRWSGVSCLVSFMKTLITGTSFPNLSRVEQHRIEAGVGGVADLVSPSLFQLTPRVQ